MARALFFHMVLRKFSEITNNKPIFSQYNIFYKCKYFFFQSALWFLFNHRQVNCQSNQEQYSLCCSSSRFRVLLWTQYGSLKWFSIYFRRKVKEIGLLRSIFPDYVISRDSDWNHLFSYCFFISNCKNSVSKSF